MSFLGQLGLELYKLYARKRTYIGFGAFFCVQVAILLLLQLPKARRAVAEVLARNGYAVEQFYGGLTLAVLILVFTFLLLGALYVALVSGDIVAKEVEDGTLRLVLSRPISRMRLMWVKWLACLVYNVTLIVFLGVSALVAATLYRGYLGRLFVMVHEEQLFAVFGTGQGLFRYARAVLFMALGTLTIASLAFMFSCFRMKPAAATILTLSVLFVDLVLQNFPYFQGYRDWFITYHTACWVRTFADPVRWPSIAESLVYLGGLNATFFVIGAVRFCNRDFKA